MSMRNPQSVQYYRWGILLLLMPTLFWVFAVRERGVASGLGVILFSLASGTLGLALLVLGLVEHGNRKTSPVTASLLSSNSLVAVVVFGVIAVFATLTLLDWLGR